MIICELCNGSGHFKSNAIEYEGDCPNGCKNLQDECIRLQQEINCLRMEPCQLPRCVELQKENAGLKKVADIDKWWIKRQDLYIAKLEAIALAAEECLGELGLNGSMEKMEKTIAAMKGDSHDD